MKLQQIDHILDLFGYLKYSPKILVEPPAAIYKHVYIIYSYHQSPHEDKNFVETPRLRLSPGLRLITKVL